MEDVPFKRMLEESIKTLAESKAKNVMICGRMGNGDVYTGYANVSAEEKAAIAAHILSDAMMDVITANIDLIRDALDNLEEE